MYQGTFNLLSFSRPSCRIYFFQVEDQQTALNKCSNLFIFNALHQLILYLVNNFEGKTHPYIVFCVRRNESVDSCRIVLWLFEILLLKLHQILSRHLCKAFGW